MAKITSILKKYKFYKISLVKSVSKIISNGKENNEDLQDFEQTQLEFTSEYELESNIKILISGPYGSGKTQFIQTLSDIVPLTTEESINYDEQKDEKVTTTVAMDYGKFQLNTETAIHLFGTPGQKRFDFMREILGLGAKGLILLVDSRLDDNEIEAAREILVYFKSRDFTPIVICANKQDLPGALNPEQVKDRLGVKDDIAVIPMTATSRDSAMKAIKLILFHQSQKASSSR